MGLTQNQLVPGRLGSPVALPGQGHSVAQHEGVDELRGLSQEACCGQVRHLKVADETAFRKLPRTRPITGLSASSSSTNGDGTTLALCRNDFSFGYMRKLWDGNNAAI